VAAAVAVAAAAITAERRDYCGVAGLAYEFIRKKSIMHV
jgi:hypothetical protein